MAAVLSPGPADVQVRAVLGPRSQPGRLDSASTTFWLFCHSLAWTRQDWGAQRLQVQVKGSVQGGWWREPVARVRHVGRRSSGRVKLPRRGLLRAGRGGGPSQTAARSVSGLPLSPPWPSPHPLESARKTWPQPKPQPQSGQTVSAEQKRECGLDPRPRELGGKRQGGTPPAGGCLPRVV